MNEKLNEGLKKLGLEFSQNQISQIETYISCVLEFNKTYNLMKADSADELTVNHILDSLAAAPSIASIIKKNSREKKYCFIANCGHRFWRRMSWNSFSGGVS